MVALFDTANLAETDRSADIRAVREAELAPPEETAEGVIEPTRRGLITGGLAEGA